MWRAAALLRWPRSTTGLVLRLPSQRNTYAPRRPTVGFLYLSASCLRELQ